MAEEKLFMLLLGCKPPGRHTEQHDVFFGIAPAMKDLVPGIKKFWRGAGTIHIDAWRVVNVVDGFKVSIVPKEEADRSARLFFINLGGYQENKFAEQHYFVLTAKEDRAQAIKEAKQTIFFRDNHLPNGAGSHVDDKYGIDVDDLYEIQDILTPEEKNRYAIKLTPAEDAPEDVIRLGYFKLDCLDNLS